VNHNAYTAKIFLWAARLTWSNNKRKLFIVRIFCEMMQSCENVVRLLRVLHDRSTNPFENLLKRDKGDLSYDVLSKELEIIKTFEQDPIRFCKEYLLIIPLDNGSEEKNRAILRGIWLGVIAALNNMLASPKNVNRVLWEIYNKLKHGSPVFNKDARDCVVIYIEPDKPIEFPTTLMDGRIWTETTIALRHTMFNLTKLIHDALQATNNLRIVK